MKKFILILMVGSLLAQSEGLDKTTRNWSLGLGFFANKSPNLLQFSFDVPLNHNSGLFGYVGFPSLTGIGITSQSNYNETGFIYGLSSGLWFMDIQNFGIFSLSICWNLSFAHQWKIYDNTFVSLGVNLVKIKEEYTSEDIEVYLLPILSFDKRF